VQALVRRTHEERVLAVLREHGAQSRSEIARRVGLSRTTLSDIAADLLRRGAISIVDTDAHGRTGSGRPAELLALDPASGQFLGIDFGHGRVSVVVADAAHEVIVSGTRRYAETSAWEERLEVVFALMEQLAADTGVHYGALQAIAAGMPGWGDRSHVHVIVESLSARFVAPVTVDNNVRFAALAEAAEGRSSRTRDLVYVRLSDGVGGGLVVDGRLVHGWARFAGELGHVTVQHDGLACRCGKRGCVETVASVPAILARCRALGVEVDGLDDLAEAVRISQPVVESVLRDAGAALGKVLGAAAMTLNPREIVIGGELIRVAPLLLEQVTSTIRYELSWQFEAAPTVRAARLGDDAGALGAVIALFHESPLLASYAEETMTVDHPGGHDRRRTAG
jgi:predicted NBD/HSP70 family sugar kinase